MQRAEVKYSVFKSLYLCECNNNVFNQQYFFGLIDNMFWLANRTGFKLFCTSVTNMFKKMEWINKELKYVYIRYLMVYCELVNSIAREVKVNNLTADFL